MMRYTTTILSLFLLLTYSYAQSFFEADTTFNKGRTIGISSALGSTWVGATIAIQSVWYNEYWDNQFHFFDDSKEWLGMDKAGHAYTANSIIKNTTSLYRWAGCSREHSLILGSSIALGYMSTIEILDGFSKKWGFSWSDMLANSSGILWYVWQDLLWEDQKIKMKFSAHLTPYAQYRPEALGETFSERILKDYNGQTYWLTIAPASFTSQPTKFPKWLGFSLGYSIDSKLNGHNNTYIIYGADGSTTTFNAKSMYLFSLDIDFENIPSKRAWLRSILKVVNHVKVPFPTLSFDGKKFHFHPVYF